MSRYANTLRIAMEDGAIATAADDVVLLDDNPVPLDDAQAVADEVLDVPAGESEPETTEAVEDGGDPEVSEQVADEIEATLEQLQHSAAGLETIYFALKDAQQRGGLSHQSAIAAKVAVESLTSPLDLNTSVAISVEKFYQDSSRLRATSLSMEQLGAQLKEIWGKIWQFLKDLKNKIWQFIKNLWSSSEKLKSDAKSLNSMNLDQSKQSNANISVKGLAAKIARGGQVTMDPVQGMNELITLINESVKFDATADNELKRLKGLIYQVVSGTKKATASEINFKFPLPKGFTKHGEIWQSPILPGNVFIQAKPVNTVNNGIQTFDVSVQKNPAAVKDEATIPTMTVAQIQSVEKLAEALHAANDAAMKQSQARAAEAAKAESPKLSETLAPDDAKMVKELLNAYRNAEAKLGQLTAKLCGQALKASQTYLKIAQRSAKEYGGKAAATPAPTAPAPAAAPAAPTPAAAPPPAAAAA